MQWGRDTDIHCPPDTGEAAASYRTGEVPPSDQHPLPLPITGRTLVAPAARCRDNAGPASDWPKCISNRPDNTNQCGRLVVFLFSTSLLSAGQHDLFLAYPMPSRTAILWCLPPARIQSLWHACALCRRGLNHFRLRNPYASALWGDPEAPSMPAQGSALALESSARDVKSGRGRG